MQKNGFAPCLRRLLLKENARVCQICSFAVVSEIKQMNSRYHIWFAFAANTTRTIISNSMYHHCVHWKQITLHHINLDVRLG